jgi:hypothetical protein
VRLRIAPRVVWLRLPDLSIDVGADGGEDAATAVEERERAHPHGDDGQGAGVGEVPGGGHWRARDNR